MKLGAAVPLWVLPIVAIAIALLAIRTYSGLPVAGWRQCTLVALRAITLGLLALFLLRPVIVRQLPPSGNVVPVLIDASRSMNIRDGDLTRFDRAVAFAVGPLSTALKDYRLEFLELRNEVGPLDRGRRASGDSSDLAAALGAVRDRCRGRSVPGVVLLSDGVDTGEADAAGVPSDLPVFPFAIGQGAPLRDQEVLSVELDPEALPGSSVQLSVTVVSHGYGREPIDVRLLASGRPIDLRRVVPAADGLPVRLIFELPPATQDPVLYTVDLPARPGEAVAGNNSRQALVQPIGRRRRVLFLQGAPGYEHGFLSRAWATDPYLDVDVVVRKGQNDQGHPTFYVQAASDRASAVASGIPADRALLYAYDAVALGNVTRELLAPGQLDALDAFVAQRGGGVLVLGGHSFGPGGLGAGPLGALLPLMPGHGIVDAARAALRNDITNKLTLTVDGERHAMLRLASSVADSERRWAEAPALGGVAPVGALRPGAQMLAATTAGGITRPLIAVQRYGGGRSMVFAGEASWRWKMQRPASDRLYELFWRQAARWLSAPSPDPVMIDADPDLRSDSPSTLGVIVRDARFDPIRDASVEIAVRDERGHADVLLATLSDSARGRYTAVWQPSGRGLFHVTARVKRPGGTRAGEGTSVTATRDLLSGGADLETSDPVTHEDVLARIAERSGGELGRAGDVERFVRALRARVEASPRISVRELWHGPWTFALIVGLLGAEWTLRRKWGLR